MLDPIKLSHNSILIEQAISILVFLHVCTYIKYTFKIIKDIIEFSLVLYWLNHLCDD